MKVLKGLLSRTTFMAVAILIEISIAFSLLYWFREQAPWAELILRIIGLVLILFFIKNSKHLSYDMGYILLIMISPIAGTAVCLLMAGDLYTSKTYKAIVKMTEHAKTKYVQDEEVYSELVEVAPERKGEFHYISKYRGFPFYRNESLEYFDLGDIGFPMILEEMKKAEKFIFLEYFIVEEGELWNQMLEVMEKKAKQGVEVRVMYDDLGSFTTLSATYGKRLEKKGIKCITFNRISPISGIIMNHRDHRKIMVIDGKTAFSGGINLADEYINVKEKYGHWKDNVIRVKGEAVWSYTVMFLTHWNALRKEDKSFLKFKAKAIPKVKDYDGFICPYGETPLSEELTAQNIYMGILNQAQEYCYIMTPYLIIDTELINALILCAKQGVDVRIITPGIPDKKLVWRITRSYYYQLIEGGVKIYEYTPGFIHSKVFVSDDKVATVGTINLDYRSLYLHFENGTYFYGSKAVLDVKEDALRTIERCHEVTLKESKNSFIAEFVLSVLRIFAPLM